MCQYLKWELCKCHPSHSPWVWGNDLKRLRWLRSLPYIQYILPSTKKLMPPPTANPFAASSMAISPSLSYGQQYPSSLKLVIPTLPNPSVAYITPMTPNTPLLSYSPSTSPASSASPPTPSGIEDHTAKINSTSSLPSLLKAAAISIIHSKTKMFTFASPTV